MVNSVLTNLLCPLSFRPPPSSPGRQLCRWLTRLRFRRRKEVTIACNLNQHDTTKTVGPTPATEATTTTSAPSAPLTSAPSTSAPSTSAPSTSAPLHEALYQSHHCHHHHHHISHHHHYQYHHAPVHLATGTSCPTSWPANSSPSVYPPESVMHL